MFNNDNPDDETQDEARWIAQFAATPPEIFQALIDDGLADYRAGLTFEFDPDIEDD